MNESTTGKRRASGPNQSATREALLDAGRKCVRSHGIAGTTSRMITSTAGANLGSITYYFGSKDELVAEALFSELSSRLMPVLDALRSGGATAEAMVVAVRKLVSEFESSPADVPVYLHALMASTESGPLANRAREVLSELADRLSTMIEQLKTDRMVAAWVDPPSMASLIIACANGIALQTQLDPDGPVASALAGQLVGLLLAASSQQAIAGG